MATYNSPFRNRSRRQTRSVAMTRSSLSSDECTMDTLSERTLSPTPVDARPAFVPFQLSDEQCEHPSNVHPSPRAAAHVPLSHRCKHLPQPELVRVSHAADQQCQGAQVRYVHAPPPQPGFACLSRPAAAAAAVRRLHLRRDARGEHSSPEAARTPRPGQAPGRHAT